MNWMFARGANLKISLASVGRMRILTSRGFVLAALLSAALLVPSRMRASTSNCPVEPLQTTIIPGEVYTGTNCNLYTDGDVDSFTFTGKKGYTYQIVTALNGVKTDICVDLKDPNFSVVAGPSCTSIHYYGTLAAGFEYTPTLTGTYTIDLYEPSSAKQSYALSLEQFFPFPSYATQIPKFGEPLSGDVTPISDANLFTLRPTAPTGDYLWTVTLPSNASHDICLWVYLSNGAAAPGSPACTSLYYYGTSKAQIEISKPQLGGNMALVEAAGNDATATYTMEVACAAGTCPAPVVVYPPCTLNNVLSYNTSTSTLTMNFTVGSNTAATWNAWLSFENTTEPLFAVPQKATVPPKAITKTKTGILKEGTVGILSTLTTPGEGITCSSWQTIDTDTP